MTSDIIFVTSLQVTVLLKYNIYLRQGLLIKVDINPYFICLLNYFNGREKLASWKTELNRSFPLLTSHYG